MHYFFEGSISTIGETQTFGEKFKKREFVVTTEGKYPNSVKFDFINENVDILDNHIEGEMVTVGFIIKGNEYNGKHYVNLQAIAIGEIEDGKVEEDFANKSGKVVVDATFDDDEIDDLPF
jgi:hypothetical protein